MLRLWGWLSVDLGWVEVGVAKRGIVGVCSLDCEHGGRFLMHHHRFVVAVLNSV